MYYKLALAVLLFAGSAFAQDLTKPITPAQADIKHAWTLWHEIRNTQIDTVKAHIALAEASPDKCYHYHLGMLSDEVFKTAFRNGKKKVTYEDTERRTPLKELRADLAKAYKAREKTDADYKKQFDLAADQK